MNTRVHRLKHCLFALTLALTLATVAPLSVVPLSPDEEPEESQTRNQLMVQAKGDRSSSEKLERRLRQLAAALEAQLARAEPGLEAATSHDRVRVVIEHKRGAADDVEALIESLGGDVEAGANGKTQCTIPVESPNALAENGDVDLVRLPFHPATEEVTEALEPINADEWHSTGYSGAGIKIGVLDTGFYDYTSLIGTELPTPADTWWAPSIGNAGDDPHGTACAEIIYDLAPNAELYFANFDTDAEWDSAVSWLNSEGVDIISCSVGWYVVGPRDGTGDIVDAIDSAKSAGIFWSQAAGNYAERHWAGPWEDTDEDASLDFDQSPVVNANPIVAEAGETIWVRLWWDDPWGSSDNDYDLTMFDSDIVTHWDSWSVQGPGFPYPYEAISFEAPADETYYIFVYEYDSTREPNLELFCSHSPYYYEGTGSISDSAASPNACTVGAVDWDAPS